MKKFSDGPEAAVEIMKDKPAWAVGMCHALEQAYRQGWDDAATKADAIEKRLEGAIRAMEWVAELMVRPGGYSPETVLKTAIARAKGEGHEGA